MNLNIPNFKIPKILRTYLNLILVIAWIVVSYYICIGGLTLIEATEKVFKIENKYEVEIVPKIVTDWKFEELDDDFNVIELINEINSSLQNNTGDQLSFKEIKDIKYLEHVYWYYTFPRYSLVSFLVLIPYTALLFLTVGTAGVFGSSGRLIIDHVRNIKPINEAYCFTAPIFGFFIGVIVLSLSYVIPSIFVKGDSSPNMISIVLICFFAGVFSERFYDWIRSNIDNFLNLRK